MSKSGMQEIHVFCSNVSPRLLPILEQDDSSPSDPVNPVTIPLPICQPSSGTNRLSTGFQPSGRGSLLGRCPRKPSFSGLTDILIHAAPDTAHRVNHFIRRNLTEDPRHRHICRSHGIHGSHDIALLTHGTSTSPATGSHASPSRFLSASAAALAISSAPPPRRYVTPPAAIAEAEPISADSRLPRLPETPGLQSRRRFRLPRTGLPPYTPQKTALLLHTQKHCRYHTAGACGRCRHDPLHAGIGLRWSSALFHHFSDKVSAEQRSRLPRPLHPGSLCSDQSTC